MKRDDKKKSDEQKKDDVAQGIIKSEKLKVKGKKEKISSANKRL